MRANTADPIFADVNEYKHFLSLTELSIPMKSLCKLVADTRERHVMCHDVEFGETWYEIAQITIGDYAILSPAGTILAVIERKSLDDYGASLKDGRHDNRKKMMDLRSATGCSVIYIVEGPLFPNPKECFAGIPYSAIESSIFHLMVRDNITVIRARDTLDTARLLARFVRSMDALVAKGFADTAGSVDIICGGDDANEKSPDPPAAMALLKAKHSKSDHEIARELWSVFAGITVESADTFIARWSVGEIASGKIPRADIVAMKQANGKKISARVVSALSGTIDTRTQERLLAGVPGISDATAKLLIAHAPLGALLSRGQGGIDIISLGKRKLGAVLAERICRIFAYTRRPTELVPTVEPVVAVRPDENLTQKPPVGIYIPPQKISPAEILAKNETSLTQIISLEEMIAEHQAPLGRK